MDYFLEKFCALLGKIVFPRRPAWQQRRNGKIVFGVLAFSLVLGWIVMKIIRVLYYKTKV